MNIIPKRILVLIPLLLLSQLAVASINLSFTPITQSANSLEIGIAIAGLDEGIAPSLSYYDFDIGFDHNQLTFVNAIFGDNLLGNQLDLFNFNDNVTSAEIISPGLLNLSEVSFDSATDLNNLQADSFTLATLNFQIVNPGTSLMSLAVLGLGDADSNSLSVANITAPITTVPLPSAFILMASSLIGLVYTGNRRRVNPLH